MRLRLPLPGPLMTAPVLAVVPAGTGGYDDELEEGRGRLSAGGVGPGGGDG